MWFTGSTKFARTSHLNIAYEDKGSGTPVLLVHGWPDDARTFDRVVPELNARGFRTIVPWMRGCGKTTFLDKSAPRSGQVVALAQDMREFLDALKIEQAYWIGHDWGARAGYAAAALFPSRLLGFVALAAGYEAGMKPGNKIDPEQAAAYWYQWLWNTERGREALEKEPEKFCKFLWKTWSPEFAFTDREFNATAKAWANPDWAELTLHAYRVRWEAAEKDPFYGHLKEKFAKMPKITVPTILLHGEADGATLAKSSVGLERHFLAPYARVPLPGIGHFVQRESPTSVVDAFSKMAGVRKAA